MLSILSSEAVKLKATVSKAITDHQITTTEYEKILAIANADMKIDPQEKQLPAQFQELMTSGAVKRVPGGFSRRTACSGRPADGSGKCRSRISTRLFRLSTDGVGPWLH